MKEKVLPSSLQQQGSFTRREYMAAMATAYRMTDPQIAYDLKKRLKYGTIFRAGRGQYVQALTRKLYHYQYSELANNIADKLYEEYNGLDFRLFEYIQLNEFINHQISYNTVFVFGETEYANNACETLFGEHPGRVLFKPCLDDYYRYHLEDQIIVRRLPSESPKGIGAVWHMRLEQIIADMLIDKLISTLIPQGEKAAILEQAFETYLVDERTMFRYAGRKGAKTKLSTILDDFRKAECRNHEKP